MDYQLELQKILEGEKNPDRRLNMLIRVLRKGINKFDYSGNFVGLSSVFDEIVSIRANSSRNGKDSIDKKLKKLFEQVDFLLSTKPQYISKDDINYEELKKIYAGLIALDSTQSSKKKNDRKKVNLHELFSFMIFTNRDDIITNRAIETQAQMVNSYNANGESIVEVLTKRYLETLTNYLISGRINYSNDLLYFSDLLNRLINGENSTFVYTEDIKIECIKLIDIYLGKDHFLADNVTSREIAHYIKKITSIIKEEEVKETLEDLCNETGVRITPTQSVMFTSKRIFDSVDEFDIRDHTDEVVVTIDGEKTEILDDGLSAKELDNGNYLLGIHIADPYGLLSHEEDIIRDAYEKTISLYYGGGPPVHIFPEDVVSELSLSERKDKLSLSYYLEITRDGIIILDHLIVKKTVTNTTKRLSYKQVDLRTGFDPKVDETIRTLRDITNVLYNRLKPVGDTRDMENLIGIDGESNQMVEFAMLALNITMSNYMAREGLPFIYIANQFSEKRIENMKKIENFTGVDKETRGFIRQLQHSSPKSFYTVNHLLKHQSLGGINYGRVSSPLIMFGDYLASEAVHLFVIDKNSERKVIDAKREEYRAKCRYMNQKIKAINYFMENYKTVKKDD